MFPPTGIPLLTCVSAASKKKAFSLREKMDQIQQKELWTDSQEAALEVSGMKQEAIALLFSVSSSEVSISFSHMLLP